MIFLTIGTQVAFDRLVSAVDAWAGRRKRADVVAQIGPTDLQPKHIEWTRSLPRDLFRKELEAADVLVAHADIWIHGHRVLVEAPETTAGSLWGVQGLRRVAVVDGQHEPPLQRGGDLLHPRLQGQAHLGALALGQGYALLF